MNVEQAFFDHVSHDLRGELAIITAGVHYVLRYDQSIGPAARQMLERVAGAAARLTRELDEFDNAVWLVDPLPRPLTLTPCLVDALLTGAVERLRRSPCGDRAGVVIEPHPPDSACVGDEELLESALEYVIDVALARSESEPVRVAISKTTTQYTVINITDSGGPVAPGQLDRLLEPFAVRAVLSKPPSGARRQARLGLGLSIAHRIFQAHGGQVRPVQAPAGLTLECTVGCLTQT